jgi:hypothetical protein
MIVTSGAAALNSLGVSRTLQAHLAGDFGRRALPFERRKLARKR